jgi:hypothetical protein
MNQLSFEPGHKYTLITMGALSTRKEIIITRQDQDKRFVYREKGSKKEFYLPDISKLQQKLIFAGHDIPIVLDSETDAFMVDANCNFVTDDPAALRALLESTCLTSLSDKKDCIQYRHPNNPSDSAYEFLYPSNTQD